MSIRTRVGMALLVMMVIAGLAPAGVASAQQGETRDLRAVSCRDVLLASGDERDGIVLVLHAYLLGEAKQATYDVDVLAAATDRFLDACIDNPDAQALQTMRKQLAKSE